jgi:Uma2 family endonuclease
MTAMQAHARRVSYADLETWPEDGRRYELYDGEAFVVPSPLPVHQIAAARLHLLLHEYVHERGGIVLFAPLDIVLTEYDVVQPDLLVFAPGRAHLVNPKKVMREPPDLAVEILSPATARNDRGRKMQLLARHGVKEYWLFDPEVPRLEVHGLVNHGFEMAAAADSSEVAHSRLFPGLHIGPAELVT